MVASAAVQPVGRVGIRRALAAVAVAVAAGGGATEPQAAPVKRERILFTRVAIAREAGEIRGVSPAGGPTARIGAAEFGVQLPDASPDGRKIAFVTSRPGQNAIFVMDSDGSDARPLIADERVAVTDPAWSPDGRLIAFVRAGDLWVARADGTQQRRIVADGAAPTWSPDSRRLAFVRAGRIHVVSAAGLAPVQITATAHNDAEPAWSPRGDTIAFARFDFPGSSGHARVYLMNADGSDQRPLLADVEPGRDPAWSPDASHLVFARGVFEQEQLYVVRADGLGLRRLTTSGARDSDPDWGYVAPPKRDERNAGALLPDLDQRAPRGLTVQQRHGRFLLGFVSATDNIGAGALRIRGSRAGRAQTMRAAQLVTRRRGGARVVRDVGTLRYTWSPSHSHWHLLGFQRYEIIEAFEGEHSRRDRKSGFCLADNYALARHRVRNFRGGRFSGNCGGGRPDARSLEMGTSPGFTDRYPAHYHGQNVDITRLPAGVYVLIHSANPLGRIVERTLANNAASVRLRLGWPNGFRRAPRIRVLRVCEGLSSCPSARR